MTREELLKQALEKASLDYTVFMEYTKEEIVSMFSKASNEELIAYIEE